MLTGQLVVSSTIFTALISISRTILAALELRILEMLSGSCELERWNVVADLKLGCAGCEYLLINNIEQFYRGGYLRWEFLENF